MIEYALLIMLGFCIGGLIALLLAPTLWGRAVRLTTKRLEATMPMSLSEIEADKDLLRASYAIRIRRLEAGLNKARDKSANQLVNISRLQMQIAEMNGQVEALNAQLEERRNAANVFESTIRKRFPELQNMVAAAKADLDERSLEISDVNTKLRRREEALEMAQRSAALQQDEIRQLRDAMERTGSDTTGRFKRRASQWGLDEYRSEYDRLNVELSKMREQLVLGQERESRQISVLKTELQQLAERIMTTAVAEEKHAADRRAVEREQQRLQQEPARNWPAGQTRAPASQPAVRAQPWPGERTVERRSPVRPAAPDRPRAEPAARREPIARPQQTQKPEPVQPQAMAAPEPSETAGQDAPSARIAAQIDESREVTARTALKSLLDRGARLTGKGQLERASGVSASSPNGADDRSAASDGDTGAEDEMADRAVRASVEGSSSSPVRPAKPDAKLDQVFREILEGRPAPADGASSVAPTTEDAAPRVENGAGENGQGAAASSDQGAQAKSESSKTQTLLDRLRVIHERQTG